MDEQAIRIAQERLALAEQQLKTLQEAGLDTGALASRLAFARRTLEEGRPGDAETLADEMLDEMHRMADGTATVTVGRKPGDTHRKQPLTTESRLQPIVDPNLVNRAITVAQLEERIGEVAEEAVEKQLGPLVAHMQAIEAHLGQTAGSGTPVGNNEVAALVERTVDQHIAALDEHIGRLVRDAVDSSTQGLTQLQGGLVQAVQGLVTQALEEHRQATAETLQRSIAAMATKGDLDKIAESLRKDLDWQVEKLAAERGWCSMHDLQEELAKRSGGQGQSGSGPIFARLEAALTEFVTQSQSQQERFLHALRERMEHGARSIVTAALDRQRQEKDPESSILERDTPPAVQGETSLDVLSKTTQQRLQATAPTLAAKAPLPEATVDTDSETRAFAGGPPTESTAANHARLNTPVQEEQLDTPGEGSSGLRSSRKIVVTGTSGARGAVGATYLPNEAGQAAAAIQPGAPAASATENLVVEPRGLGPVGAERAVQTTLRPDPAPLPPVPALNALSERLERLEAQGDVTALVRRELERRPVVAPETAVVREVVLRLMPELLQDHQVRQGILALVANEALADASALGELTGIRAFIRHEIRQAAEQWAKEQARTPAVPSQAV